MLPGREVVPFLPSKSDGTPLSYFEYTRLPGGNISKVVRETGSAVYYTYDLADRLTDEVWE